MPQPTPIIITLFTLMLLACGPEQEYENSFSESSEGSVQLAPAPVRVAIARIDTLVERVQAAGLTAPVHAFQVVAQVGGRIVDLPVQEGQQVAKDQLLLALDDSDLQLELDKARSQFIQASIEYGRIRGERQHATSFQIKRESRLLDPQTIQMRIDSLEQAVKSGKALPEQLQFARAEYEAARLFASENKETLVAFQSGLASALQQVRAVEQQLQKTRVIAPFGGVVAGLANQSGAFVAPGTAIMQILDLSQIDLSLGIIETEVSDLTPGRQARVHIPALGNKIFQGRVRTISPLVDPEKRTCQVTVRLHNPQQQIKVGMYATAEIAGQLHADVLLVPREAILERDNRKLVFVVRENLAQWCYVQTGRENKDLVEIISSEFGLEPGEPVIVDGHYTLVHDAPVRVEDE
jgi:RND family efflux transporter MFP subunit